jgi:phospholipid/cholesterol/gamma-HCH transport system substrate-binding protein
MKRNFLEVFLGFIVIFVAICFMVLVNIKVDLFSLNKDQFTLIAKFDNINGVVAGSDVKMSGVNIGSVRNIEVDLDSYEAILRIDFKDRINLPEDTEASIQTDGLLGGGYVSIIPGGSDVFLSNNQEIVYTQGATSLINLMLKFASDR